MNLLFFAKHMQMMKEYTFGQGQAWMGYGNL